MKKPCIVKHLNNFSDCFQLGVFNHHPAVETPGHGPRSRARGEKVATKDFSHALHCWGKFHTWSAFPVYSSQELKECGNMAPTRGHPTRVGMNRYSTPCQCLPVLCCCYHYMASPSSPPPPSLLPALPCSEIKFPLKNDLWLCLALQWIVQKRLIWPSSPSTEWP